MTGINYTHYRSWWRATKPTTIAGPLFLAKECPVWRQSHGPRTSGPWDYFDGNWVKISWTMKSRKREKCGHLLLPAVNTKIKTAKIYSKANTTFSQNSASAKLSRYMVCLCDPYSKFHWPSLPSYGGWIKAWTSRSGAVPDEKLTCNKW